MQNFNNMRDELIESLLNKIENMKNIVGRRRYLKQSYAQVKRFRMETKAAKTLGIIVGGFILCWLPFFTMYIVRAFCPNRIHPTIFSVLFWLGYCNSAINPCIYALFSKDFRFAFKKIICCKCSCMRRPDTLRRGSDGSQLAMRSVLRYYITKLNNVARRDSLYTMIHCCNLLCKWYFFCDYFSHDRVSHNKEALKIHST